MQQDPSTYATRDLLYPDDPDRMVTTEHLGLLREGDLKKRVSETHTGGPDEPYWCVAFEIEYCMQDCTGDAHVTGVFDPSNGYFCEKRIHRSVYAEVRKFPDMVPAIQQM